MFSKEKYREKVRKRQQEKLMKETGGTPQSASFHRRAYHREFEGWSEVKRVGLSGKVEIQRVYTGKYFEPAIPMQKRIALRALYVLLLVLSGWLFGSCAFRPAVCNTVLYVGFAQALTVGALIWIIYVLIFYVPTIGKMTIGDYNTLHRPLLRSTMAAGVCMGAAGVLSVLSFFLNRPVSDVADLLCSAGFIVSGCIVLIIHFLEKKLIYKELVNETAAPESATEIE
jgi:hypothetical protein